MLELKIARGEAESKDSESLLLTEDSNTQCTHLNLHEADDEEDGGYTVVSPATWTLPQLYILRA